MTQEPVKRRAYLALFLLPNPQREHVRLVDVIRAASGGDFRQVVFSGGVMYFFSSETPPWKLSFDRILHNGDSVLISELSEQVTHQGFGAAAAWMNTRFPRK